MRVLHVTLSASLGGRRDAILTLSEYLQRRGVECGLLALRDPAGPLEGVAKGMDYCEGAGIAGRPTLRELAGLHQFCRAKRVDVLHAHDGASQYVASALRMAEPSRPAVMTFHRTLAMETAGVRNRLRNGITLPLIRYVLTATEERRRYFLASAAISKRKMKVIPLGVDLTTFRPDLGARSAIRAELGLAPETVLILAIGHAGSEKGLDQAVNGLARAASRLGDVPWHLVILGGGLPGEVAVLHRLAKGALGDRVTLAGFRTDVPRWLQAADLLLHAPRLEAFGLVVVQAMASGVPTLATTVGGLPEVIEDGVSGRLVPAGDIEALADGIVALLTDEGERRRLGAAAIERAREHFDAILYAERHLSLYRELVSPHPGMPEPPYE